MQMIDAGEGSQSHIQLACFIASNRNRSARQGFGITAGTIQKRSYEFTLPKSRRRLEIVLDANRHRDPTQGIALLPFHVDEDLWCKPYSRHKMLRFTCLHFDTPQVVCTIKRGAVLVRLPCILQSV